MGIWFFCILCRLHFEHLHDKGCVTKNYEHNRRPRTGDQSWIGTIAKMVLEQYQNAYGKRY